MWNPMADSERGRETRLNARSMTGSFPARRRIDSQQPATRDYSLGKQRVPLVSKLAGTELGVVLAGRTLSQITLTFSVPYDRDDWGTARVWVKNFRANKNFVMMGEFKVSPAVLLLEVTSETLTIAVQTETTDGRLSDIERSPTVVLVNNG